MERLLPAESSVISTVALTEEREPQPRQKKLPPPLSTISTGPTVEAASLTSESAENDAFRFGSGAGRGSSRMKGCPDFFGSIR